jgi:hypothetical protein
MTLVSRAVDAGVAQSRFVPASTDSKLAADVPAGCAPEVTVSATGALDTLAAGTCDATLLPALETALRAWSWSPASLDGVPLPYTYRPALP